MWIFNRLNGICLLAAVGCGSYDESQGGSGGGSGHINVLAQAHTWEECDNGDITSWTVGTGSAAFGQLMPVSTHLCWLTQVQGDGTHQPRASLMQSGGYWTLESRTAGGDGEARAHCVPRTCFSAGHPDEVNWISEDFRTGANAGGGSCALSTGGAWLGDAATILNGWETHSLVNTNGKVGDIYDHAKVRLRNSPTSYAEGEVRDCNLDGWARYVRYMSFFVGVPGSSHYAVYKGPNDDRSWGISNAGHYCSRSDNDTNIRAMAYTDEGICFLTGVNGDLATPSERARIYQQYISSEDRYRWVLRTYQGSGIQNYINACAACYLYDQSQSH